ncbi:MAG TPA: carboxypeptidase regulatory-like domain-containing protein, partial [Mycobacteriales bacterium]|nr:carboxypeptidase regulatory-like domain-containing protein [Mycobacteriales bacterium]
VEYSTFEYSATARTASISAVSVRGGSDWIFRHNEFRNIVGPSWQMAGPAILAWGGSTGTIVDSNAFVNCSIGVAFGQQESQDVDHRGGIIRNNMMFRSTAQSGGVGIRVANAPSAQVLNNTVFLSGTYGTPIEYQFELSRDVVVANDLLDGVVWARDGATGSEAGNVAGASADLFVDAARGDLHLSSRATAAIDRGVAVDVSSDWDGKARPVGRGWDVGADEFGASFKPEAPQNLAISGRVADAKGASLANVTIRLTGTETHQDSTKSSGSYSFSSLASGGSYTVTPSMNGYTFAPPSATFTNATSHQNTADFTAATVATPAATTVTLTSPSNNAMAVAPAT